MHTLNVSKIQNNLRDNENIILLRTENNMPVLYSIEKEKHTKWELSEFTLNNLKAVINLYKLRAIDGLYRQGDVILSVDENSYILSLQERHVDITKQQLNDIESKLN